MDPATLSAAHLTKRGGGRSEASPVPRSGCVRILAAVRRALLVLAVVGGGWAHALEGLPLSRFYPFEEIGNVSRGALLTFDAIGRVAVVQDGSYVALNDSVWIDLVEPNESIAVRQAVPDRDGTTYYGALGSWGVLVPTPDGKLRPQPLLPADYPKWVLATNFDRLLCTSEGVYFAGWNGVVFLDRATRTHRFFAVTGLASIFSFDGRIYVSSHEGRLFILDAARGTLVSADRSLFGDAVVVWFAATDRQHAMFATSYRSLLVLEQGRFTNLTGFLNGRLPGGVAALVSLVDGDFAVSVAGLGLFIIDPAGQTKMSLTGPEYARITALANNEPGVLWAATETGLLKILYGQPFTTFGQTVGLPVSWPQVVSWEGQTVVASNGRVYELVPAKDSGAARFQPMAGQPPSGAWGIATAGSSLLVTNGAGVFVREPGTSFRVALGNIDGARLVATDASTCFVIGTKEIAVLTRQGGGWTEAAPRIPGLGYPAIVHAAQNSAWIELGGNRAARLALKSGRLEARLFESFPWSRATWVNVSVLGSKVVLAGAENKRLFFDEDTESLTEAPGLDELLDQSPYPLARIRRDDTGTYWGSHEHGILSLQRNGSLSTVDLASYAGLDERVPLVQPLPGGDVWLSTGHSLYHLDRRSRPMPPPVFRPRLVSVHDSRTNEELLQRPGGATALLSLRYAQNSLVFGFFAGSYGSKRAPAYEYQLNGEPWTHVRNGSSVVMANLHEGRYRLSVRLRDSRGPVGMSQDFEFAIAPPWYRAWYALALYPMLLVGVVFGVVHLSLRRAAARNAGLEKLVADRTHELQATMAKLQQETRTSATLAERNRLAGEIHDSLEQGFTGLTLQLETTANFPSCPAQVKSGLGVALNMVAFSRNEVRNAVRDMHSPILASADLETALRQILAQVAPHPNYATLRLEGSPARLGSTVEHHLLRIAQEAIANAVKHAAANHLTVTLTFRDGEVELDVRDDGCGFDAAAILNGGYGHFGLPSFRGRASKMGGTVAIVSAPGAGTRITVRVPLEKRVIL